MKQLYNKSFVIKACLMFTPILLAQQVAGEVPKPDAFYKFDETNGNVITDHSGNNRHAWWYNYNQQDPGTTVRTGWRPESGKRGGAGYFNGDHVWCENSCSSGSDLIIFKTSTTEEATCHNEIPAKNDIFRQDLNNFTISFWYKNMWNYLCEPGDPPHACIDDNSGCAWERQVLIKTGGSNTGLVLETFAGTTFPALLRLTIAGGDAEKRVVINAHYPKIYQNEWVHYAIVFEGDAENNTGKVRLYVDFELVNNGERDTPFGTIYGHDASVVFGGQAGNSVTDFNINTECWGGVYDLCGITADQVGRLRYGWLARGYVDEFAFWASKSLTKEEIKAFDDSQESTVDAPSLVGNVKTFSLVPTFASDQFKVVAPDIQTFNLTLYNSLGQIITTYHAVHSHQVLQLPSGIKPGLYLVGLNQEGMQYGVRKLFVTGN